MSTNSFPAEFSTFDQGVSAVQKDLAEGWVTKEKLSESGIEQHIKICTGASPDYIRGYLSLK